MDGFEEFLIADRWSVDPHVVAEEWSEDRVEKALAIIRAEGRYAQRNPGKR